MPALPEDEAAEPGKKMLTSLTPTSGSKRSLLRELPPFDYNPGGGNVSQYGQNLFRCPHTGQQFEYKDHLDAHLRR